MEISKFKSFIGEMKMGIREMGTFHFADEMKITFSGRG